MAKKKCGQSESHLFDCASNALSITMMLLAKLIKGHAYGLHIFHEHIPLKFEKWIDVHPIGREIHRDRPARITH